MSFSANPGTCTANPAVGGVGGGACLCLSVPRGLPLFQSTVSAVNPSPEETHINSALPLRRKKTRKIWITSTVNSARKDCKTGQNVDRNHAEQNTRLAPCQIYLAHPSVIAATSLQAPPLLPAAWVPPLCSSTVAGVWPASSLSACFRNEECRSPNPPSNFDTYQILSPTPSPPPENGTSPIPYFIGKALRCSPQKLYDKLPAGST